VLRHNGRLDDGEPGLLPPTPPQCSAVDFLVHQSWIQAHCRARLATEGTGTPTDHRGDHDMEIDKQEILEQLRGRGEDDIADRAEQQLPDQVDTDEDHDLLHSLGINPTDLLGGIAGTFG